MILDAKIQNLIEAMGRSPLLQYRPLVLVGRVGRGMAAGDASHNAAGVAYFAIFSLFPLMLGVLSILGMVLTSETLQQRFLLFATGNLPGSAQFVESNLEEIIRFRGALGVGAILGSVWLGTAVFAAISRAVNRAWGISLNRPFYLALPRRLLMGVVTGSLFLLSTTATSAIQVFTKFQEAMPWQWFFVAPEAARAVVYLIPWAITLLIFLLIYRFEPRCRTYWRYVWPGALVASLLFEGAKYLFVWYLDNLAIFSQVHGSLASVVVLLLWVYLSALLLILGAQVCYQYELLYRPGAAREGHRMQRRPRGTGSCRFDYRFRRWRSRQV